MSPSASGASASSASSPSATRASSELVKGIGHAGFLYSSDGSNQDWLNSIMCSERKNAGTQSQPSIPLVHKVLEMLRDSKDFKAYYEPSMVSIGPYHSCNTELQKEELKSIVVRQFLEISGYKEGFFDVFEEQTEDLDLRNWYDQDSKKDINENAFTKMMFLDGCFILYFIYYIVTDVKNLGMKNHFIALVQQDLFLLENQLPFPVLDVLMTLSASSTIERSILDDFVNLNAIGLFTWIEHEQIKEAEPLHLLDLLWKRLIGRPSGQITVHSDNDERPRKVTTKGHLLRNVKELRAAGILFRPNKTGCLKDLNFRSYGIFGKLTLPCITIDSSTRPIFLNLLAHEVCMDEPREFWITSYLCFLGLLIHHAEDVSELRTAGIIENSFGSDAEVATLISEIAGDLKLDFDTYGDVKLRIQKFFRHSKKTKVASWLVEVHRDHCKSPWTIIAVVTTSLAIFLAVVQTYIAVYGIPYPLGYKSYQPFLTPC